MPTLLGTLLQGGMGFAVKFKGYLIAGAAVLAVTAGAYGAGYLKGENHVHTQDVAVARQDTSNAAAVGDAKVAAVITDTNAQQASHAALQVRNLARERELQVQVDGLRDQKDNLQRLLNAKADPTPDCRVALGDVRMLNDAGQATPGAGGGGAQGAPDPARVAAYQEQAPSQTSCRALVSDELAIREQYGELAAHHDGLVDWVQKELIDPQKPAETTTSKGVTSFN